eukprot:EG_transcript_1826
MGLVCVFAGASVGALLAVSSPSHSYIQPKVAAPSLTSRASVYDPLWSKARQTRPSLELVPNVHDDRAEAVSRNAVGASVLAAPLSAPQWFSNAYVLGAVAAFAVIVQLIKSRMRPSVPPILYLPPSAPNVHSIWESAEAAGYGNTLCAIDEHHGKPAVEVTYSQMRKQITQFAGALQSLGVEKGTRVGLFAENSHHWLVTDQALMTCGGISAVRGAAAPIDELLFILEDSGSTLLVVENEDLLRQLTAALPPSAIASLKSIVVLFSKDSAALKNLEAQLQEKAEGAAKPRVYTFDDVMALGATTPYKPVQVLPDDVATLVYTSGTTGKPKGAMLSHGNLLNQANHVTFHNPGKPNTLDPRPGDVWVTILPCWHVYERATEYWMLSHGVTLVYTNKLRFKSDVAKHRPHFLIAVPRIYELIYTGVQQKMKDKSPFLQKVVAFLTAMCKHFIRARRILTNTDLFMNIRYPDGVGLIRRFIALLTMVLTYPLVCVADVLVFKKIREATGGRVKAAACGGASLPMHLEDFYEMAGIPIIVGYGLTETSPVIASRRVERNIVGSTGIGMACTLRIVDEQTGKPLPPLSPGVVQVKGSQVFSGYYGNPEATAKAFTSDGFFDTGDSGYMLKTGELVLSGRVKDIIVLTNGENIEPSPIEDAILSSPLIEQVMLVGHGQRGLGALVVPNMPELAAQGVISAEDLAQSDVLLAANNTKALAELADKLVARPNLWKTLHKDMNLHVKSRKGYRADEQVIHFKLVLVPFSVENRQLTQTLKVKRNVVEQDYDQLVGAMFK